MAILTEGVEHLLVSIKLVVGRSQEFVSGKDRVGSSHEAQGLLGFCEANASSREADHGLGHDNTSSGNHTDHVPDLDRLLLL